MVLVARVQDVSEIWRLERSDDCTAIHDARDALEALRNFDVIGGSIDARKRAEHLFCGNARLERSMLLGIPGFGLSHSTGHPQHDDGIGAGISLVS